MEIRTLRPDERFDSDMISRFCFHERFSGDENEERAKTAAPREDWGAFDGHGRLAAHIINNHLTSMLNGRDVQTGGVGAVSTLPEYRSSGAIRGIFARMLPERRRQGEVISCLYPFKHSFYRKFGYETVQTQNTFTFRPAALKSFHCDVDVRQYRAGDALEEYVSIHERFRQNYSLSIKRDAEKMRRFLLDRQLAERKFAYIFTKDGEGIAYVCFTDQYREQSALLNVTDLAWTNPAGFRAILGFLARFEADYGLIRLPLPTDINLRLMVPDSYEIEESALSGNYMLRVLNVPAALMTLAGCASEGVSLKIRGDGIIPENNGAWRLDADGVKPFSGEADLDLSLNALNQLICGSISLKTALLRQDVSLNRPSDALEKLFCQKSRFVTYHY